MLSIDCRFVSICMLQCDNAMLTHRYWTKMGQMNVKSRINENNHVKISVLKTLGKFVESVIMSNS